MLLVTSNTATGHTADQGRCLQSPKVGSSKPTFDEMGLPEGTKHQSEDSLNQESLLPESEPSDNWSF